MREIDARAIRHAGITGFCLMQRAARSAWQVFVERWPKVSPVAVICGPGNNGADALLLACEAVNADWSVQVFAVDSVREGSASASPDARQALASALELGIELKPIDAFEPERVCAVIDGLFGTGIARPLVGSTRTAVERINRVAGHGSRSMCRAAYTPTPAMRSALRWTPMSP